MNTRVARLYAVTVAIVLGVQGTSTLAALTIPAFDRAFPSLLAVTRMIPQHSGLHVATALLAIAALLAGRTFAFAAAFGAFYTGLALAGWITGSGLCLSLQPFDHPFHLVLGGLGLLAAAVSFPRTAKEPA